MDDPRLAAEALSPLGSIAGEIVALTAAPEVKAELTAATDAAVAQGVFGLPTFFFGAEMWFGKDRLEEVERALMT